MNDNRTGAGRKRKRRPTPRRTIVHPPIYGGVVISRRIVVSPDVKTEVTKRRDDESKPASGSAA